MKIILLTDLEKLGKEGDTREVKDGYARNYLIPRGFALQATEGNFKRFQELKRVKEKNAQRKKQHFLKIKEQIEKASLTITAEAKENEELYGSINEAQILKLLEVEGISVQKNALIFDEPIRKLGVYNVGVHLYPGIEANLRLWVVKK